MSFSSSSPAKGSHRTLVDGSDSAGAYPRRMEEASVAGESPDRSEQRKSSGTAPGERDPRLAVFRETEAPEESGGRVATDTATAVFRTPPSVDDDAPEGLAETVGPCEGSKGADGAAEGAGEATNGNATGREEVSGASKGASGGSDGPEDSDGDAIDADGPGDADDPDGAGGPDDAEAPGEGDARLRAAVAAWVSQDETDETDGAVDKAGTSGKADEQDDAGDKGDGGDDDATAKGGADVVAVPKSREEALKEPAKESVETPFDDAEKSATDAETDDGPEAGADDKAEEAEEAEERVEVEADGKPGTEHAEDAEPAADAEVEKADAEVEKTAPTEDPKGSAEPAKSEGPAGSADPEESAKSEDGSGIDQPTAVFRALRPPKLDQPTTALKITPPPADKAAGKSSGKPAESSAGKKAKSGSAPEPSAKETKEAKAPKPDPESPAERTSKFLPLRTDDVRPAPAPRKPESLAPAAAADSSLSGAERTRQQPMPPRPPLDLLAELTNTPPPRETPVRTAVRRVKIWTPLVLLLLVAFAIAQAVRPLPAPVLGLSAKPTYTFAGEKLAMPWPEEGQGAVEVEGVGSIGGYGKQKSAPIASVAKVMTAYVILKQHPIAGKETGPEIEVDKKAGEDAGRLDESNAPIKEGQKYTERQMLQLLMIPSGNNTARLLARWDAKSEKAFVAKMNAAAKDLGMNDSTYTDPSGLEASTKSTPADQIKLAEAVMKNDVFREIVNMPQADIPGVGKTIYNNNNILLQPGVSGIKTGSSTPAGGNLVWAADTIIDGKSRRVIGAVMGAEADGTLDNKLQRALQNSLKLIQTAQKGVDSAKVVKKGDVVGYVDDGLGGRTPVVATRDLKAIGWGGLQVTLDIGEDGKEIPHTAKAGAVVGSVTVGTGTGKVSVPVALQKDLVEPGYDQKLRRIS